MVPNSAKNGHPWRLVSVSYAFCHGRGRGFEPRRPRHTFQKTYAEWVETREGAKGHRFVPLLCPFRSELRRYLPQLVVSAAFHLLTGLSLTGSHNE
jgi:hypothetical protein